jgi:cytidylate kinase
VSAHDAEVLTEVARRARVELTGDPDHLQVKLDGRDVTAEIRTEQASRLASVVSTVAGVRRELVRRQREMGAQGAGVVLDGRDIGTVVFPRADVKFFITALAEERARRRYEQDHAKAPNLTYSETLDDINTRDERDSTRDDSPLRIAADAIVIDTTELTLEEVFARMLEVVRERQQLTTKAR